MLPWIAKGSIDNLVTEQMNAARGRLKTIVFNPLYAPIKTLLLANCKCSDGVASAYQRALLATNSWPLEELGNKKPMAYLLGKLSTFTFETPSNACMACHKDYKDIVSSVVTKATGYFDGLCLDCMDASNTKTGSTDTDYWLHNKLTEEEIVCGCRVKRHGQPTWYFSFMGRKEEQDRFRKECYEKRKGRRES